MKRSYFPQCNYITLTHKYFNNHSYSSGSCLYLMMEPRLKCESHKQMFTWGVLTTHYIQLFLYFMSILSK